MPRDTARPRTYTIVCHAAEIVVYDKTDKIWCRTGLTLDRSARERLAGQVAQQQCAKVARLEDDNHERKAAGYTHHVQWHGGVYLYAAIQEVCT